MQVTITAKNRNSSNSIFIVVFFCRVPCSGQAKTNEQLQ